MRRLGLAAMSLGAVVLLWWCRPAAGPSTGPDGAIVCAASWTAWLSAAYLGFAVAATASTIPAPLPGAVRHLVERTLGLGVVAAVATGGLAGRAAADGAGPRPPAVSVDWPSAPGLSSRGVVRVGTGDCLWDIAAHRLAHPTPARIVASWPRWWHANRRVIGADPDVLHPGQRLRPPVAFRSEP